MRLLTITKTLKSTMGEISLVDSPSPLKSTRSGRQHKREGKSQAWKETEDYWVQDSCRHALKAADRERK